MKSDDARGGGAAASSVARQGSLAYIGVVTAAAKKILEQALALPEEERLVLLEALSESLEQPEAELSQEWKAEIERRIDAVERGDSQLVAWDEVQARVRKTLARRA